MVSGSSPSTGCRSLVQEQDRRAERKPVAEPVVDHVVKGGVVVEHDAHGEDEHQPPDRVPRPVPGHHQSDRRERHADRNLGTCRSQRVLPGRERQRYQRDGKHQHQGGQDGRGRWRRQPGTAPPSPRRRRVAGGVYPHKSDATPGPFRERYRSAPNPSARPQIHQLSVPLPSSPHATTPRSLTKWGRDTTRTEPPFWAIGGFSALD